MNTRANKSYQAEPVIVENDFRVFAYAAEVAAQALNAFVATLADTCLLRRKPERGTHRI